MKHNWLVIHTRTHARTHTHTHTHTYLQGLLSQLKNKSEEKIVWLARAYISTAAAGEGGGRRPKIEATT